MANVFWILMSGIILIALVGTICCMPGMYKAEAERMGRK